MSNDNPSMEDLMNMSGGFKPDDIVIEKPQINKEGRHVNPSFISREMPAAVNRPGGQPVVQIEMPKRGNENISNAILDFFDDTEDLTTGQRVGQGQSRRAQSQGYVEESYDQPQIQGETLLERFQSFAEAELAMDPSFKLTDIFDIVEYIAEQEKLKKRFSKVTGNKPRRPQRNTRRPVRRPAPVEDLYDDDDDDVFYE